MPLAGHPEIIENESWFSGGAKRQPLTLDPRPTTLDAFTKENVMNKICWFLSLSLLLCGFILFASGDAKKNIQAMLDAQAKSWNEGNIDGYMKYYWNSEKLTFQSGAQKMLGWKALLAMYKSKYSGKNMGILNFSDIEITMLSEQSAYVLGRWKVTTKNAVKEGVFTLILKHMPEGWRIIHDHSS